MESEGESIETKTPDVLPPGPRRGKTICTFWQGRVEMALRFLAFLAGSLPALTAAVITFITPQEFGDIKENVTNADNILFSPIVIPMIATGWSAACVIIIAGLAVGKEILMITLLFYNRGCVYRNIKILLTLATMYSFVASIAHCGGGCGVLVAAVLWGKVEFNTVITRQKITLSICAAFCYISTVLYLIQGIWSIVLLVKKWNKRH